MKGVKFVISYKLAVLTALARLSPHLLKRSLRPCSEMALVDVVHAYSIQIYSDSLLLLSSCYSYSLLYLFIISFFTVHFFSCVLYV